MEVRKEVIRTGKHVYIGADGRPAVLDTTKDKIDHYFNQGQAMLAAGIPIPLPLEHDSRVSSANPADIAADLLRNNGGEVLRYETDVVKNKNGHDVHRLMSVLNVKDDQIANKIKNGSVRWVSPWISSFVDGAGKAWNEVVSHVALTTRPRIHEQQPFESISMALSIAKPQAKLPPTGFYLPNAGLLKEDGQPAFPIAFSMMTGVKLSEDDLKNIEDDEAGEDGEDAEIEGEGKKEGGEGADPMAGEMKKEGGVPDPADETAGDVSFEELIPHLLEMHGIHVPAGGKGKEFLQSLVQGLLASAKAKSAELEGAEGNVLGGDPNNPAADPNNPAQKGPIKQESPPMYMSLTQIDKIKDPEKKQMASMLFSLHQNIIDKAKTARQQRIERVCKAVPPKMRDRLLHLAGQSGAALSLSGDGSVVDPLTRDLEAAEMYLEAVSELPDMLRPGGVKLSEQDHPDDSGYLTPAQAEELANRQTARVAPVKQSA